MEINHVRQDRDPMILCCRNAVAHGGEQAYCTVTELVRH